MANPNTLTPEAASSVLDQAARVAAEGSRRSTENARAALQASREYFDHAAQVNRDLFALWTAAADASLQTAVEIQNAALSGGQAWLDTSANLSRDAFRRWSDLTRQAQTTTLKNYQASTRLFEGVTLASY